MSFAAHNLYCYAPQRRAVEDFFAGMGLPVNHARLHPIEDHYGIAGLRHINFVVVKGHPHSVPFSMLAYLETNGAVIITFDDSPARARYASERSTNRRACGACAERYPLHDGHHVLPDDSLVRCQAL